MAANEQLVPLGVSGSDLSPLVRPELRDETEEFSSRSSKAARFRLHVRRYPPRSRIYDPAGQLVASGEKMVVTYVTSSLGVPTVKTTVHTDQWVSTTSASSARFPRPSAPLVADYLELIYALPSVGATLCSFEAARDGHLTILGIEQNATDQFGSCCSTRTKTSSRRPHPHRPMPTARGRTIADWITSQRPESLSICGPRRREPNRPPHLQPRHPNRRHRGIYDTYRNDALPVTVSDTFNVTANGVDYTSTTPTPSTSTPPPGPTRSNWSTPTATTRSPSRPTPDGH